MYTGPRSRWPALRWHFGLQLTHWWLHPLVIMNGSDFLYKLWKIQDKVPHSGTEALWTILLQSGTNFHERNGGFLFLPRPCPKVILPNPKKIPPKALSPNVHLGPGPKSSTWWCKVMGILGNRLRRARLLWNKVKKYGIRPILVSYPDILKALWRRQQKVGELTVGPGSAQWTTV